MRSKTLRSYQKWIIEYNRQLAVVAIAGYISESKQVIGYGEINTIFLPV